MARKKTKRGFIDAIFMRGEVSDVEQEPQVPDAPAGSSSETETVIADAENQIYLDQRRLRDEEVRRARGIVVGRIRGE